MKRKLTAIALMALPLMSQAEVYRYNYTMDANVPYDWQVTSPKIGAWENIGSLHSCSNWSPSVSTVGKGTIFTQTATDCKQDQERVVQPQVRDSRTGILKDDGPSYTESQTISAKSSRDAVGILENWASINPTYTDWTATNALYGCTGWTPDPSIYTVTANFSQKSSSCSTDESRLRQEREQEKYTDEIRNIGNPVTESRTLTNQSASRAYSVALADWSNNGAPANCTNWSPDPSTITIGQEFQQTATDCKQAQMRPRTESYVDHRTGQRLVAKNINETRTVTVSDNRKSVGTKETWAATTPTYTAWTNNGAVTACTNWSPAPETVTIGKSFTQTATDCSQAQTRTRQDREQETTTKEVRNVGSKVTENQTITASSTRSSTGTKETWAATTPTYTAWVNSGAVTSCSNWSPAPSTVTVGSTFTQTATDCKQPQTRSRQDREQETTTKQIRNSGTPVTETQSITASSTRSATGTKETWMATTATYTAWVNSGAVTSCSNWSPAPSTVTVGSTFTQTATDCKQAQTRTRQDREQETTTKAIRNNGSPVTESQSITASSTRSATGTKETWVVTTSTYTAWVNSGAVTSCSNWSPAPSTVTVGSTFTQTATDCKQAQTRSRQDREQETTTKAIRNKGAAVTETQSVTASSTRTATGTKETWVATTPTYSAWANSGAVSGCSNWAPDPSTVNAGTAFTQTATNCQLTQVRNRQNRIQETTTKEIRNSGAVVQESQVIGASSTRTATGTKIVEECRFDSNNYYQFMTISRTGKHTVPFWDGKSASGGTPWVQSITVSSTRYKYYTPDAIKSGKHTICRVKI